MNSLLARLSIAVIALTGATAASADNDFGIGVKAGTLGLGVEGTWRPLPYLDFRIGANAYDYEEAGTQAGLNYDGTLALDTVYGTANLHFPVSPFRLTVGAFSNGNELQLVSDEDGDLIRIGDQDYPADLVGTVSGVAAFSGTSPYAGVGFDFTVLGKLGLNLDFGVLWQGEPGVALSADGTGAGQGPFEAALEVERQELEDDLSDYKAWPVVSLAFIYNF